MTASIRLTLYDAYHNPLGESGRLLLANTKTDQLVISTRVLPDKTKLQLDGLIPLTTYRLTLKTTRHRAIQQYITTNQGIVDANVFAPLNPSAAKAFFPGFRELPGLLSLKMDQERWDGFSPLQKAGLLNIFTRMLSRDLWSCVYEVHDVYQDRLYLTVNPEIFKQVTQKDYDMVSGILHAPPEGFMSVGSYKTREKYGNLQLTFFKDPNSLDVKLEVDIDDAGGLEHCFQVLRNSLGRRKTHPYDIQQIQAFGREQLYYRLT